jgi:hypothetical protein
MDFLEHTLDVLSDNGKGVEDIEWIGTEDSVITWEVFAEMAERIEDLGVDSLNFMSLPRDLRIVGQSWWMELEEYPSIEDDDQIEWAYREKPLKPGVYKSREIDNILRDRTITDFKVIFGDEYEHNDVAFLDTYE